MCMCIYRCLSVCHSSGTAAPNFLAKQKRYLKIKMSANNIYIHKRM